jgi:protein TonB
LFGRPKIQAPVLQIERTRPRLADARKIGATWLSAGIHLAAAAIFLFASHWPESEPQREPERPAPDRQLVWVARPGPEKGGGVEGHHNSAPARQAERPGRDRLTVPVRRPPSLHARATVTPPPAQQMDIPAVPSAAGLRDLPGVITEVAVVTSADGGPRAGEGSGDGLDGDGLGRGRGGNRGGGPRGPGSDLVSPEIIRQVRPNYTSSALQARVRGLVVMDAIVLADGSVGDVKIVRSLDRTFGLDDEAIKAVKQWRFRPGRRSGDPVAMMVSVEMMFELR